MADSAKDTIRKDFSGTSLPRQQQELAEQLATSLQENTHAYESHVQFIKLLHKGFVDHVYPPSSPESHGDPHSYDLLEDLRAARERMDKMFAIGEDLWADWIQDESMLARTVDERLVVMEKCQRSIEEEFGSTKLWVIYGDWMLYLYNAVQETQTQNGEVRWPEEEKMIGREVFNWQSVFDVWKNGAEATKLRINDSNLVWDRFIELLMRNLENDPSQEKILHVKSLFDDRLLTPHATWDQTFQTYSTFISRYFNTNYEEIMITTTQKAADAKAKYAAREVIEVRLQRAAEAEDKVLEWAIFQEYLEWELTPAKRRPVIFELVDALYQRAELRFASDPNLWEDHVMFVIDESSHEQVTASVLPILERGTRHCPWSGALWSQYLLSSEKEGRSYEQTQDIKHKATNTGLLEVSGIEEVIKVHTAWCSYLRRRAFQPDSSDEDLDVAEMGIRSAIENLQELGTKQYGKDYKGDPLFRLERVYMKYLTESGSWDSARETYKGLIKTRGDHYEFWIRYYMWEMIAWGKFIKGQKANDDPTKSLTPHYATAVLRQAVRRSNLDWPEKLMQMYIQHCEDHEDVEELQMAIVEVRKATKAVTKRREREALAAQQQQQQVLQAPHSEQAAAESYTGKRKREEEADTDEMAHKKTRAENTNDQLPRQDLTAALTLKRDRENATILVENLPEDVSETRVRQFFRDCGAINGLKVFPGKNGGATAIVEFDSKEDALFAQSRDGKDFEGHTIQVQLGSGSTLFVANFPPTADESYLRNLFRECGEIVDVRFPSLKYNTHRRFCYVQFKLNSEAQAAASLHGQIVGDDLKLVAKVSNPLNKQERTGPMEEGREVYVKNVDWNASEDDVKELFSRFGKVESVRIPRNAQGRSKGFAYVVFPTTVGSLSPSRRRNLTTPQDDAHNALAMNLQEFRGRQLHVQISSKVGAKRVAATILSHRDRSESAPAETNGEAGSPSTTSDNPLAHTVGERKNRTLGLMNIPDTVNDSRVRSIVEQYGPLVKIVLRPDHQGAIVEYADVNDAGKAALGLEGHEIVTGRRIRVGSVAEMLKQAAEKKTDRIQVGAKKKEGEQAAILQGSGQIRRPAAAGGRGGRRGGLGQKRGLGLGGGPAREKNKDGMDVDTPGKSNNDFRDMLSRPQGEGNGEAEH